VGQSLAEFKRASEDFKRTWEYEVETERTQSAPRVEPETVVARESLGAGDGGEVDGGEVDGIVADDAAVATEADVDERLPEGQTIARAPSDFPAAREAEPDDDAPNVVESSEPVPGKQQS
jgi:hypothetical protein